MSRYKYDGYQDFVAGLRFIASLIAWLKQFASPEERRTAYAFVRHRLVYIGPAELNHLVHLTYPQFVLPKLASIISQRLGTPPYLVWKHAQGAKAYSRLLRASLFFALSDGARIDAFRRANSGIISNEQVLIAPQIHASKWDGVLKDLVKEQGADAKFECVFLLDDFTASGATLIRKDPGGKEWKGKLVRFWEDARAYLGSHFVPDWTLQVHHYIGSAQAQHNVINQESEIRSDYGEGNWFKNVSFTYGTILPNRVRLLGGEDTAFLDLVDRYYDPSIQTIHTQVGGGSVARGFGGCSLPVVLDHNTPNNSLALIWAESDGMKNAHSMRPLFRRRQRHV